MNLNQQLLIYNSYGLFHSLHNSQKFIIVMVMDNFNMDTGMFGTPYIALELAVVALVVLVISGLLAGLIPASRALSVRPVDALRAE